MYKVVIIDDEIMAIQFLEQMLCWEEEDCVVLGSANSSSHGLSLVQKHMPDIVFMDIEMPDQDGLSLSRQILTIKRDCKIIILTAHSSFDYAKTALQIGVFTFLIKHELTKCLLRATLRSAKDSINSEKAISGSAVNRCIESLYKGAPVEDAVIRLLGSGRQFAMLTIKMNCFSAALASEDDIFYNPVPEDAYQGIHMAGHTPLGGSMWGILYTADKVVSSSKRDFYLMQEVARLTELFELQTGLRAMALTSEWMPSATDVARLAERHRAIRYGVAACHSGILTPVQQNFALASPMPWEDIRQTLENHLHTGEGIHAEALLAPLSPCRIPVLPYADFLAPLCSFLLKRFDALLQAESLIEAKREEFKRFSPAGVEGFLIWLNRELGEIRLYSDSGGISSQSLKAARAARYLREHYAEDIGAEDVAVSIGVSESYLRAIFRQEFSTSLGKYLQQMRICAAKKMVASGNFKVGEIAIKCGFKTSQYFCSVFHTATGMTPLEYSTKMGAAK